VWKLTNAKQDLISLQESKIGSFGGSGLVTSLEIMSGVVGCVPYQRVVFC